MADRINLKALSRDPELVAALVASEDIFSFLSREMSIPPSCAALAWGKSSQPRLVAAGRTIEAAETRELLFVRTVPFTIDYRIEGLASGDGLTATASLALAIQVIPEKAELLAFRKTLLGNGVIVRKDDLRKICADAVRRALVEFAKAREAATLVSAIPHSDFEKVLDEYLQPLAFESGLVRAGAMQVRFESPQYAENRRVEEATATRRKQQEGEEQLRITATQARTRHLEELGTLLDQVRGMAAKSGSTVADLIRTFEPTRRGALYEGLAALNRPAGRTEAVLVVAGEEILAFDRLIRGGPCKGNRCPRKRDRCARSGSPGMTASDS